MIQVRINSTHFLLIKLSEPMIRIKATFCQLKPTVIFMLGGPGSGKGTQSQQIQQHLHFQHLSAGELLRQQRQREGSTDGALIEECIVSGRIVPSEITVRLLDQAMKRSGWEKGKFLIDGFPRNLQNLGTWDRLMGKQVFTPFIIFLECSQETMLKRLSKRAETSGRSDDNISVIKKRFATYEAETMPVVRHFMESDRVLEASCEGTAEEIFRQIMQKFNQRYATSPK